MPQIKTDNIKLIDLRFYDKNLGVEVDDNMPKAIAYYNSDEKRYYNVIEPYESYPAFKRIPYSNTMTSGIEYGSKLYVEDPNQIDDLGICAIECNDELIKDLKANPSIEMNDIEKFILSSDMYFKDKASIAVKKLEQRRNRKKLFRIINKDREKNDAYARKLFYINSQIAKIKQK